MFRSKIPTLVITKEHGSWAVLLVPMLVSICVVRRWSVDVCFAVLAALGVFLSYVPAQLLLRHHSGHAQKDEKLHQARFWIAVYIMTTGVFTAPLLLKGDDLLLAIGAAGTILFLGNFFLVKQYSRTIATDLIAVAGLTLSGPSVYYVLTGTIDKTALSLYGLNLLFFGSSVFYVHMKIHASASKRPEMTWGEKLSLGKANLAYHASVIAVAAAFVVLHFTPAVALAAFLPMLVHAVYGTLNLTAKVNFKRIGLLLLGQSILFALLVSFSFRK
ncbi:MAG TPA: YwiC-like family protein [Bacteroidota bacterium]|nr:YwiC-like family protein [Bacteroidota bacterium]